MIYYSFEERQSRDIVEVVMWKPWEWASASQAAAVANARAASIELSRRRVERDDVELFLARIRSDDVPHVGAG